MSIKVGDTLYRFDINRRVYPEPNRMGGGGPIYAEHFVGHPITGETRGLWICDANFKVNKATMIESGRNFRYRWFTAEGMAADIWRNENIYKLRRAVETCRDIDILRKIAALVSYSEAT